MNEETQTHSINTVLVTLGRIEERLSHMSEKENKTSDRLDKLEGRLSSMEMNLATNMRPRTPWYVWATGVGSILVLALNGFSFFNILTDVATNTP
jgi:hypothetical protein